MFSIKIICMLFINIPDDDDDDDDDDDFVRVISNQSSSMS